MPFVDPKTGEYSDTAYALDTAAASGGERSLFESLGNFVTKGIPLTGQSIINSFANTGIAVGNFFGGKFEPLSMETELKDESYKEYYADHSQGIEMAGLALGSMVPGLLAIKALKLAQAGKFTEPMKRATNIFAGPRDDLIKAAETELRLGDAALFPSMQADKVKAIAYGFGDQALQGLAYEIATVATMKQSPLLEADGVADILHNMFFGALVGGGIGGVIEGIGTRAIFKRAELYADTSTKAQEMVTYLGKGNYSAGDRVASILDSLDKIPEATGALGKAKLNYSRDAAILNSKKILGELVETEDKALTNSFFDMLWTMKSELKMGKEEMYDYLARLGKVSRVDAEATIPDGRYFYISSNIVKSPSKSPTWGELATALPVEGSRFSLRYKLREYATSVNIAHIGETIEWEGKSAVKYKTAKEAFEGGADAFVGLERDGKGFRVHVNPQSQNLERVPRRGESRPLTQKEEIAYRATGQLPEDSKQFLGAPLKVNVKTGAVKEKVSPVVGDYGVPVLVDSGRQLQAGDKFFSHSLKDGIVTAETAPLEANSRYVWFAERGIQKDDKLNRHDIAGLEQLYRQGMEYKTPGGFGNDPVASFMDARWVRIEEVGGGIVDSKRLLGMIEEEKQRLIAETRSVNSKISNDELSRMANVPEAYIETGIAKTPADMTISPAEHMNVNHVQLEYDIGSVTTQDGMILRGLLDVQERIKLGVDAMRDNAAKFLGPEYDNFLAEHTSLAANIHGVGAKGVSSSNANYDTLGQEMERIGRFVTDHAVKRMGTISDALAPSVNALRNDQAASAEWGMFRAVRLSTSEKYSFLPPELQLKYQLPEGTVVLSRALVRDKTGVIVDWKSDFLPEGFISGEAAAQGTKGHYNFYKLSPKVAAFEDAQRLINNERVIARNNWYSAQGLNRSVELDTLYTPPIDTAKYPHFALVKPRPGTGMASDEPAIITAETAADLQSKIAALKDDYSVYTKDLLKTHHEVLGDYEYGRNFAETSVNSDLRRRGILNNIFPDTRAETIIKDYIDWNSRQELRLLRDHVETANGQLFAELHAMGERFTSTETSKTGFVAKFLGKTSPNPYNSYIKTALGISEKDEYRLWNESNEKLEAFFSTAFRAAKESFTAAKAGIIPFEEAAKIGEKFGLGNPYGAATDALKAYYEVANKLPPERYLSKFVATANSILAATAIRLDVFQSVINAVSTPVLLLAEANSARNAELTKLLTTELPDGSGRSIPAISKLFYNSISNWFSKEFRNTWMPLYQQIHAVRNRSAEYFEMIDHLTLPYGKFTESATVKSLKDAVDLGGRLTGSELSEEFGRFIAADSARQIFEAAGYTGKQLHDNITTFVNRVHGNYVASQRPIAFQGPIGQAVGLFQTYQFNLLQQLFRYVENGEGKTLAILAGIQGSLFGLQGLPGFQAINNHIVGNAANNPAHKDLYSTIPNLVDKKVGDYLLYGVLSNWMQTGLYTRGDINPRQITILPVNPLDFPAVAGGIKFLSNVLDTSEKIVKGGGIAPSLLLGLEHNGLSRPLSGLGQMLQGYSSTSKGSLVATTRPEFGDNTAGLSDWIAVSNFSRLLGARPLDEAIIMDRMYRKTLYQAKDTARMNALGEAVKTTLVGNQSPTDEQRQNFVSKYAASGGRIENFSRKMLEWSQDANASVANKMYRSLNNPLDKQSMLMMGGVRLPDYTVPSSAGDVNEP